MKATELSVDGVWLFEPTTFPDDRGSFTAPFQGSAFREALGFDLTVAQANQSVSRRGVIRGVHFADVPPGQAKYIYVAGGAVRDIVVDLRVGSPTFGRFEVVELDARTPRALYLAEGLGHGFQALTDRATVGYLCSTPYAPAAEHGIDPLDPELGLPWADGVPPVLSAKDRDAPTLRHALDTGMLPSRELCDVRYEQLRMDG
ncbi:MULTISPECIES: dTDP-4-dehydrorhamnose 3,5-epimerase family protein [Pseudonocardia]|uniref:dTDP-4-dehydrorhamnose 3,5-epimerase n=2 Tax=Pseudonocardia TaxID=1847 RepID=A0A1Y2N876_PSEAH|nr:MULTISPECIES: dTDP-4-dehydrorhamnose 3,5-epimerase [Pseudonocardia]OSY43670.1 dTDP-4-dehydrorhamnose 3,5-epimerase [Pseudonocardia autotrophica]TDN73340.1 dTDP-4-dehydrorhamnose 3,5-epimerase [Pseudonocardia autotrophica]BBG04078.1 dTDP-4-dehydrorhamnose 3,5-epimerase [Pseudonocardia autotrophica]GEC26215.1 dTDP-4-dehydrorhamnose 3,5-epimerase [Pseudonocardia saturnea]